MCLMKETLQKKSINSNPIIRQLTCICYLDGAGNDGKPRRLHTGPHVEDDVLVPDVGEGPHILQPGLDLLVILGLAAVDHHVSMPPSLADGGHGSGLDGLEELQLTVLDSELSQQLIDHFMGVGPGNNSMKCFSVAKATLESQMYVRL